MRETNSANPSVQDPPDEDVETSEEGLSTESTDGTDPEPDLPADEGIDAELGDDPGSGGD